MVFHKENDEIKTIKNLKTKIENNDLIVSNADKGQSVTIIKKEEYIRKNKFLLVKHHQIQLNINKIV